MIMPSANTSLAGDSAEGPCSSSGAKLLAHLLPCRGVQREGWQEGAGQSAHARSPGPAARGVCLQL